MPADLLNALNDADFVARFWARVDRGNDSCCWNWTGLIDRYGYGRVSHANKPIGTHRFALVSKLGRDLGAAYVLHSCDNRACCNPAHLREGTHRENLADRWARHPASRKAFLSKADVKAIRSDPRPRDQIAAEFNIAPGYVSQLKLGSRRANG